MKKYIVISLALALMFAATTAFAASQGALSVKPGIVGSNSTVAAQGAGFSPNADVVVSLDGSNSKTVKANSAGSVSFSYVIPSGTQAGVHTLSAQGPTDSNQQQVESYSTGTLSLLGTVQVGETAFLGEQTTPGQKGAVSGEKSSASGRTELPFTGGTLLWAVLAAGLVLIAGSLGIRLLKKN